MSQLTRYSALPADMRLGVGKAFLRMFREERKDTLTIASERGFREAEVVKLMHLAREHERSSVRELVSA